MSTKTYEDAISTLNNLQTNFQTIQQTRLTGKKNMDTLLQMFEYSKRIGFDSKEYNKLNPIHITGTKGKGSTCTFVNSILNQYNDHFPKIGLYTSPHLRSVRERIQINNKPISETLFTKYFFEVYNKLKESNDDPTLTTTLTKNQFPAYFKFLTLLSFYIFMKEKINVAIFEVGIGGELDSTNILNKPICCGISSIAIDHTFVLGNTVEEISWNKSGIFKKDSNAFTVKQTEPVEKVIKDRSIEKGCKSFKVVEINKLLDSIKLGIDGEVQKINASLAMEICAKYLGELNIDKDINLSESIPLKFKKGLELAHIDGRSQVITDDTFSNLTWFIDGSHTKESIQNSTNWWNTKFSSDSIKILLFNQQSRNIEELLNELIQNSSNHFDYAFFTTNVTWNNNKYDINLISMNVDNKQIDKLEMQQRSEQELINLQKNDDKKSKVELFQNIESSINKIKQITKENPDKEIEVFVCGSLHLVGGLLVVLNK